MLKTAGRKPNTIREARRWRNVAVSNEVYTQALNCLYRAPYRVYVFIYGEAFKGKQVDLHVLCKPAICTRQTADGRPHNGDRRAISVGKYSKPPKADHIKPARGREYLNTHRYQTDDVTGKTTCSLLLYF
jgi:hypothetical protein